MNRLKTYFTTFGTFERKPMSRESTVIKHKVPESTCRIETNVPCALCGVEMKAEWLELHLAKSHETTLEAFLDAIFEGDQLTIKEIKSEIKEVKSSDEEKARLRAMLTK